MRPANHPRVRLQQYAAWAGAVPDWPQRLVEIAPELPLVSTAAETGRVRREYKLTAWRKTLAQRIGGDRIGGTRLDNLICDGWLPLLAAQGRQDLAGLWYHWFPGDLPPYLTKALRELGVFDGRANPACHGTAQGLLGRGLAQEMHQK